MPRLLDLFCGIGGSARGYQQAGFHVAGVDLQPITNYAGDEFHQADAMTFPVEGFDAIHASPPCQRWSPISRYQRVAETYQDLIAPVRERLRASGVPSVMENVPQAPLVPHLTLCGQMFGLPMYRHRVFEFINCDPPDPIPCPGHPVATRQSWSGYNRLSGGVLTIVGHTYRLTEGRVAMEMPWARSREELNEAIPPAYARHVGTHLGSVLERQRGEP